MRRIALIMTLVLAAQVPGGAFVSARPNDPRLERIEAEIRHKRQQIKHAEARRQGLLEEISRSDARRDDLTREIEDLQASLAETRTRLADTRASLRQAKDLIERWSRRLAAAEESLLQRREDLGRRAANAYKLGAAGYMDVILGAEDLRSLTDRVQFVDTVLLADATFLRGLEVARELVEERRSTVREQERDLRAQERRVEREEQRLEELKAEREALRNEIDMEIAHRHDLVEGIEQNKEEYERAVRELEAESAWITAQLRGSGSTGSGQIGGKLHWPTAGSIGSGFGWRTHPIFGTRRFHAGVDIGAPCGQAIYAGESGRVISSGWQGGYGQTIVIDHGRGLSTLYAHQSSLGVGSGATVRRAQRIGSVGTTGWSTGCHLHFEVRVNGNPVDPVPYLT
ncbi:MAG TPA: peptidoglycan DD-metalloendopeptidase family protein [Actinomycetota bacterium]|nr:peptidoglycan DD-metalloendopeptidase family protein [Actinomycetota bacterium]